MKRSQTQNLVLAGLFVAVGLLLPKIFHLIAMGGPAFLPMHIPVLLAGFICGPWYGLAVGIILPLLSSVVTSMPPIFPTAIAMAFELGAYGLMTGIFSKKIPVYPSLIAAMLGGRLVSGIANTLLLGMAGKAYSFEAFISAAFIVAIPGIAIQLVIIPAIMAALKRSALVKV